MATLALGVAGAAIGSMFGPLGASIGWGVGAALGGALFPGKGQDGPRIEDKRVQISSYGQPIPIGYGTVRLAGCVIWTTDLIEHKEKHGGKGGPSVTTYNYSASFAVALCEGPIIGILRIWADGRLVYGSGSPGDALPMTLYLGDEEQLPDPTMEAVEGVGNVPAHRGTAYVVFADLDLSPFYNRVPNLTFEVIASGSITLERYADWPVAYSDEDGGPLFSVPLYLAGVESVTINGEPHIRVHRYRAVGDYEFSSSPVIEYQSSLWDLRGVQISETPPDPPAFIDLSVTNAGNYWHAISSLNSGLCYTYGQDIYLDCSPYGKNEATLLVTYVWLKDGVPLYTERVNYCDVAYCDPDDVIDHDCAINDQLDILSPPIYFAGHVYACGFTTPRNGVRADGGSHLYGGPVNVPWIKCWPAPDGIPSTGYHDHSLDLSPYTDNVDSQIAIGDDGFVYVYSVTSFSDSVLLKIDSQLNVVKVWTAAAEIPFSNGPGESGFTVYRGCMIAYQLLSESPNATGAPPWVEPSAAMYRLNADDSVTFVARVALNALYPSFTNAGAISPIIDLRNGFAAYRAGILTLGSDGIRLSEIVADVSDRVGYDSGEYDVEALTDIVSGYTLANRMSGRTAIDTLRPVYQFGAVESGPVNKYRKWTGAIDATVDDDDLGARPDDNDPPDPIIITRTPEAELPRQIDVVYINKFMDYQEGHQLRQREVTSSELEVTISAPVVLNDDEAIRVAEVVLFNGWMEREKFSFSLPRKWAYLEPTDVISLAGRSMRIINKQEHGYTHIAFDALATGVNVFVSAPASVPPVGFVPPTVPIPNATELRVLDLPLIGDSDFANGHYASVAGTATGSWPGATIFKSSDGGVNYSSLVATSSAYAMGRASTVLGDFTGGHVFDEINTVTIVLTRGSPELTSSNELGVLNGANVCVIDDEVLQFRTATLIEEFTYQLSGLLRGIHGTEWAIGLHVTNGPFEMLPDINIEGLYAEIGQERLYKAVTAGQSLASAPEIAFTNNAIALKEYAPVELGGGRDGGGDLTIEWTPRSRKHGAWLDGGDVPAADLPTIFAVVIYTDSTYTTIAFSLVVTAVTEYIYTAAQQTSDFGSPQATLYLKVGAVGARGIGYYTLGVL